VTYNHVEAAALMESDPSEYRFFRQNGQLSTRESDSLDGSVE
jgi:hypothetical protein